MCRAPSISRSFFRSWLEPTALLHSKHFETTNEDLEDCFPWGQVLRTGVRCGPVLGQPPGRDHGLHLRLPRRLPVLKCFVWGRFSFGKVGSRKILKAIRSSRSRVSSIFSYLFYIINVSMSSNVIFWTENAPCQRPKTCLFYREDSGRIILLTPRIGGPWARAATDRASERDNGPGSAAAAGFPKGLCL